MTAAVVSPERLLRDGYVGANVHIQHSRVLAAHGDEHRAPREPPYLAKDDCLIANLSRTHGAREVALVHGKLSWGKAATNDGRRTGLHFVLLGI